MDNINFVEDIRPDRMKYTSEISEYNHDVENVSRSLLIKLIGKKSARTVEQRAHERFHVDKDAFALIRSASSEQLSIADRNMAEIACAVYRSKAVRFGRIDNISMGGLSFRYIAGDQQSTPSPVLDILVAESGFYLENLMFKNISDFEIEDEFEINSFKIRLNRVQFEVLKPVAVMKLNYFLKNCSVSGVKKMSFFKDKPYGRVTI